MKVWRVETPNGNGPFMQRNHFNVDLSEAMDRHPGPIIWRPCPELNAKSKFAFSRLDTLHYVFGIVLPELFKAGYRLIELDVEPTAIGIQDQVVFDEFREFEVTEFEVPLGNRRLY